MLRIHKQRTRAFIVRAFEDMASVASIPDEWEDMVYVQMVSGEMLVVYLIDRFIDLDAVRALFQENTANNIHTLLLLSGTMLLPEHKALYVPEDWMLEIAQVYGGHIFNYRVMRLNVDICPMHFVAREHYHYFAYYGARSDMTHLQCRRVTGPSGTEILIADFLGDAPPAFTPTAADDQTADDPLAPDAPNFKASDPHTILGLALDADRATIKARFRVLARRYHPDVDTSDGAKSRMQVLNGAYRALMHTDRTSDP